MNFARRAFLQFTAGAVGGTLLSPLPWKLADDSAIWSQNWSWRPSPERGHVTSVPTTCLLCDSGCGIKVHLVNGNRAIYIEGNEDHPVNKGGVCPIAAAGLQFFYAPYRIPGPLKQTKQRGDIAGFQPISWPDAINDLSGKLSSLRAEGRPQAVACIASDRRSSLDELLQRFLAAFGSPNFYKMPSHSDSTRLAAALMLGQNAPLAFSVENAATILSFGANLIEGWGSTCRMQAAYRRWQGTPGKTTRIIQVESRCSLTAAKADAWIPVAPGTEAALAMAIAHVMIKEKMIDAESISNNVFGFSDWVDATGRTRMGFRTLALAPENSPEEVAKITGVDARKIRELAKEFAAQPSALAVWGSNYGNTPDNIYHDAVFLALNVLKGNVKPGGLVGVAPHVPLAAMPDADLDPIAVAGLGRQRLDLAQSKGVPFHGSGIYGFLDAVSTGAGYPIDILMVSESNPAHSLPENSLFLNAIQKVGTLVSFSSYMDETAALSDLILPNHSMFERFDDVIGIPGAPYGYYAVAVPVQPPRLSTKHTGEVILELGKAIGGTIGAALAWESYEAYLQERVNGLAASGEGTVADQAGLDPAAISTGQVLQTNYEDGPDLWKKLTSGQPWVSAPIDPLNGIETLSGRIELAFQRLLETGGASIDEKGILPHFAPLAPSGDASQFPLLLVTYQQLNLASGFHPNPPFLNKTVFDSILKGKDILVQINPETGRSTGLKEGDAVILSTPQAEAHVRVHLTPTARPGVVYMIHGLGHKAYDEYIQDKGVNANSLIEVQMDPVTGLGTVWATRAQLRRA